MEEETTSTNKYMYQRKTGFQMMLLTAKLNFRINQNLPTPAILPTANQFLVFLLSVPIPANRQQVT